MSGPTVWPVSRAADDGSPLLLCPHCGESQMRWHRLEQEHGSIVVRFVCSVCETKAAADFEIGRFESRLLWTWTR